MELSSKDRLLIEKARLHISTHTATDVEKLLVKVIDEKVQDLSYYHFESFAEDNVFSEGLEKFNNLSKCLIECTEYLQLRKNSVYDAMVTVYNYAAEVIWDKTKDKGNKKPLKDILIAICEEMEYEKEYTTNDIKIMIEDNFFCDSKGLSTYLGMFINLGFLERIRPGVYKRVKTSEI